MAIASTPRAPKILRAQGEKLYPALPQTVSFMAVFWFSVPLLMSPVLGSDFGMV
jgi:hypothetical protein